MNPRIKSSCTSSPTKKEAPSFYRYLKPGALAQIRDSKFTAKSRNPNPIHKVWWLCNLSTPPLQQQPFFPFENLSSSMHSTEESFGLCAAQVFCYAVLKWFKLLERDGWTKEKIGTKRNWNGFRYKHRRYSDALKCFFLRRLETSEASRQELKSPQKW